MQGYMYSIFSGAALVIHLIINFDLLAGRGMDTAYAVRYRGFVMGVLAYYVTDAVWGIFAGLGWRRLLYADTVLFFLALVVFVLMWGRFVISYLGLGKRAERILGWSGYALLAANIAALAANFFTKCFFYIDADGVYQVGKLRNPAFCLLVAFLVLTATFVFRKAVVSRDSVRRRGMMVFQCCITMAVAMVLQIILPLTPFTALGCLICISFFHVFVLQDKQAMKHLAELEKALSRAQTAEKARNMFFSVVSHDIRTPLNAILGYSELLQSDIQKPAERDEACALRLESESPDDAPEYRSFTACFTARSPLRDRVLRTLSQLLNKLPPVWVSVGSKRLDAPVVFASVAGGRSSVGKKIGNGKELFYAEAELHIRVCTALPRGI